MTPSGQISIPNYLQHDSCDFLTRFSLKLCKVIGIKEGIAHRGRLTEPLAVACGLVLSSIYHVRGHPGEKLERLER